MGQPTFFFPSNLPSSICRCDKPLELLSTCPAYSNFLFIISFVKCNSVCNSVCTRIDLLIRHFIPPTYPEYHSVTPHFKSIYFEAHRTIPSPSLTPIIQYREHVIVQYIHLCTKPDIASH